MKKEEIILKTIELCEEIEALGYLTNVSVTNKFNMISCSIHEFESPKVGKQLYCQYYYYNEPSVSDLISYLQNFINQNKQVA